MLDFPASPTNGQQFTGPTGIIWVYDGVKWTNGGGASGYAPLASPQFSGDPQAPTAPVDDSDLSIANTQFVQTRSTALNNVGRNLLHNPLFNIAQRGMGSWSVAGFTADRWYAEVTTDTISYGTSALSDPARAQIGDESAVWALNNNFVGNAAAGASNDLIQRIEGVRRLSGKTIIISFWAVAGSALKLGINIAQIFGSGGSPSAGVWVQATGQSVTLSTTWTRYSVTFSMPSTAGKTLGTNANSDYTQLLFAYSSGATNNATYGNIGVQSGSIALWGVQLEVGSVATPLEKPDPQQDLAKCQRFYQTGPTIINTNTNSASVNVATSAPFTVPMRAIPTLVITTNNSINMGSVAVTAQAQFWWATGTVTASGSYTLSVVIAASADL